jgi:predicted negative regulator of RcsB-dependent stress response
MNLSQMNEHEQWEAIKTWWKGNGVAVVMIVIIAVGLSFGFRYWQQSRVQKAEQASVLYDQLLLTSFSLKSDQLTTQVANDLEKNYSHTPYAALAAFIEAREAAEKNDLPGAQHKLQWVIDHAKGKDLRQIARVRIARVLLALEQPEQALKLLEKVEDAAFMPAINQVKGDILLSQGKNKEARAAYEAALAAVPATEPIHAYLEMEVAQL